MQLVCVAVGDPGSGPAVDAPIDSTDDPNLLRNCNSGLCLSIPIEPNVQAVQHPCTNSNDQRWIFSVKANGHLLVINVNSRLCLTGQANDDPVVQTECDASLATQEWDRVPSSGGTDYQLRNVGSGRCLVAQIADHSGPLGDSGAYTYSCFPIYIDQRWYLTTSSMASGDTNCPAQ